MALKYIRFDNHGFVLFTGVKQHSEIAAQIKDDIIISAGFVSFNAKAEPTCYGHSHSLGIASKENEDSKCLLRWMGS